jgi:hypothetical protein
VAAFGRSEQFQSGKINEYEWLLSARSGRSQGAVLGQYLPITVSLRSEHLPLVNS